VTSLLKAARVVAESGAAYRRMPKNPKDFTL
jgi:hypothetical protein